MSRLSSVASLRSSYPETPPKRVPDRTHRKLTEGLAQFDDELGLRSVRREGPLPVEADHPGNDAFEVARLDDLLNVPRSLRCDPAGAGVGGLDLVANDVSRHCRREPDDEKGGPVDLDGVPRAVFHFRAVGRLVRDLEAGPRLRLFEREHNPIAALARLQL